MNPHHPTPHHPIHQKKSMFRRISKYLFFTFAVCVLVFTIFILVLEMGLPDPKQLTNRQVHQSTKIYDRTGTNLIYEIFSEKKRTVISLDDLPSYVINATLAVEDKNFYSHHGIAWKSLARAVVSDVLRLKSGRGGASTLTQQLVKNAIVGNERSLTRKLKEALLALKIERTYSKKEILELYFNEIPYGSTNYGIEAASVNYFGTHAKNLSIAQATTIAALPQAPTRYLNHIDQLTTRRDYILNIMVTQGFITKEEATHAQQEKIEISRDFGGAVAPHFVLMIKEQLTETFGEQTVDQGGLSVITSLDLAKQKIAEEEVTKGVTNNRKNYNAYNAALISLDVRSGEILAYVGSADFHATSSLPVGCNPGVSCKFDSKVDVVRKQRQPGSSFKPFVYLAGFMKGFTPETILYDVVTSFRGPNEIKDYTPHNYDLKERGPVTIRKALQGSLNIPAVKMLYLVGVDSMLELAKQFGYSTFDDKSRFGLSLVLGGGEVTLADHTAAYATLARGGVYLPIVSILKVSGSDGVALFENKPLPGKQVADNDAVATISNVLSDNASRAYVFGANSPLQLGDRPVAAKTGTTNDYHDGWVMGYTPSIATGVWAGNNDNTPMNKAGGSLAGGTIWNGFMKRSLEGTPIEQFPPLPPPKTDKPVLLGNDPSYEEIEIDSISGKRATSFTPDALRIKKKFFTGHSILFSVNKDDPKGPAPSDPTQDPQFGNWEKGIREWATKQGLVLETPPTEYDDTHTGADQPTVSIVSPTQGQSVERIAKISVSTSGVNGISGVKYFVDNVFMGESTAFPLFEITLSMGQFTTGFHTLTAAAYDVMGNKGVTSVDISITGEPDPPTSLWEYPPNHSLISANDFPLEVRASFTMPERITGAVLLATREGGTPQIIGTIGGPISGPQKILIDTPFARAGTFKFEWNITYDNEKKNLSTLLSIVYTK